jgi:uncharacterized protein (DUF952 family)
MGADRDGLTLHLVPLEYWRACDASQPYVPETFGADGFIHCTDDAKELMAVGNRYYVADRRVYIALVIDKARVKAEVRYDDPECAYPHIYGPLNRDAIVRVVPAPRDTDGRFLPLRI